MTVNRTNIILNIRRLIAAILTGSMLFLATKTTIVRAMASEEDLSQFLTLSDVEVTSSKGEKREHSQIKYKYNGNEVFVTDNDNTNADPQTDGEYIVWMAQINGTWQIMLHYIPGDQTIQLTNSENNVNPSISGKYVAWEGQVNGTWQIFLFDGIKSIQLTDTEFPNQDVGIDNANIVYTQKDVSGEGFNVFLFELSNGTETNLTPNTFGSSVEINGNIVSWIEVEEGKGVTKNLDIDSLDSKFSKEDYLESELGNITEETVSDTLGTEEATEATTFVEESTVEEILENIIIEGSDLPSEITINDIEEELGIPLSGSSKETNEDKIDSETQESTSTSE